MYTVYEDYTQGGDKRDFKTKKVSALLLFIHVVFIRNIFIRNLNVINLQKLGNFYDYILYLFSPYF